MTGTPATVESEITAGGRAIAFVLRRMRRRRHVHLSVGDDGRVEVRAPSRYPARDAADLVRRHAAWVIEALERAHARRLATPRIADGLALPLLDERLRLTIPGPSQLALWPGEGVRRRARAISSSQGRVWRDAGCLHVEPTVPGEGPVRALVERWYRRAARESLGARLEAFAAEIGVRPVKVAIRGQRSRWGSCSSRGTVSLNWRLMLVPGRLADYVVVHELCHLRHMDHSRAFWAMVARTVPDHADRRAALDAMQTSLPI